MAQPGGTDAHEHLVLPRHVEIELLDHQRPAGSVGRGESFYTTLILLAVLTSQAAGAWIEHVLRRGWPLLSDEPAVSAADSALGPERAPG